MRLFHRISTAVLEALHTVPTADATTNANMRDVVGNKTDASQTTVGVTRTLIAYVKGILTTLTTPPANSNANTFVNGVLGNKEDAAQGIVGTTFSVIGYLKGVLTRLVTLQGADSDTLETLSDQLDAIPENLVRKTVTMVSGDPAQTLFTVTGDVRVVVAAICKADVGGGATSDLSLGITGNTAVFIAPINGSDLDTGEIWHDATPDATIELWSVYKEYLISGGSDILLTTTGNCYPGELHFTCFWSKVSADGNIAAA